MRIGFLTHYTDLYGANRSLLNLIDGLADHGVASHVLCPHDGDVVHELKARDVPVDTLPFCRWMRPSRKGAMRRLFGNFKILPTVARRLREWDVDVVYTNSAVIPIGLLAARVVGRPHVWHLREFGDLDYDWRHDWGVGLFKNLVRRSDAKIAISDAIRSHHLDPHRHNVHVIYNGVAPLETYERNLAEATENPVSPDAQTFALVGKVQPKKGQTVAIEALSLLAKRFPRARLLIVGSNPDEHHVVACRDLAHELGVAERVEFWGYVHDPREAYRRANAVLMCSQHEAWGRVTVEAMSMCKPVIGHRGAGTVELIEQRYNGLLYDGGAEALAGCMALLLEHPALAREMGMNGWSLARASYSEEYYARQVAGVLTPLVARARQSSRSSSASIPSSRSRILSVTPASPAPTPENSRTT